MLDITPPTFSGNDHEKVEQMAKYISELYEAINRKVSCMSIDDFEQKQRNQLRRTIGNITYPHGYEE